MKLWMRRKCQLLKRAKSLLLLVGTAGFEFNGLHARPLSYRHLGAPKDRIGSYRQLRTGKHYGKQVRDENAATFRPDP
jgi:hypothetical protein